MVSKWRILDVIWSKRRRKEVTLRPNACWEQLAGSDDVYISTYSSLTVFLLINLYLSFYSVCASDMIIVNTIYTENIAICKLVRKPSYWQVLGRHMDGVKTDNFLFVRNSSLSKSSSKTRHMGKFLHTFLSIIFVFYCLETTCIEYKCLKNKIIKFCHHQRRINI